MPKGFTKWLIILIGTIMVLFGLAGVPQAVLSGGVHKLVFFTVLLFAGIGLLGWVNK